MKTAPKVALITGAAKRIGAAIARMLHASGWNVVVHYHLSQEEAQRLAADLNDKRAHSAFILQADLADSSTYKKLVEAAAKHWGRLDALVNNVSTFVPTVIGAATFDQWNTLVTTNLQAPFFLSQSAIPYLRQSHGAIVNITDTHADGRPLKHYSVYSITKAGLLMQTETLARELAPTIRVNAVAPGVSLWNPNALSEQQQEILQRTPLRRSGRAEEVAKAVKFLLEEASYTTGSTIYVDGGRSIFN